MLAKERLGMSFSLSSMEVVARLTHHLHEGIAPKHDLAKIQVHL